MNSKNKLNRKKTIFIYTNASQRKWVRIKRKRLYFHIKDSKIEYLAYKSKTNRCKAILSLRPNKWPDKIDKLEEQECCALLMVSLHTNRSFLFVYLMVLPKNYNFEAGRRNPIREKGCIFREEKNPLYPEISQCVYIHTGKHVDFDQGKNFTLYTSILKYSTV